VIQRTADKAQRTLDSVREMRAECDNVQDKYDMAMHNFEVSVNSANVQNNK